MKPRLMLGAAWLLAGGLRLSAADSVEVNGIARLGAENLACLLVYQPARPQPLNFTLAEGESRYGFKLIAVDATGGQVLLEKCGVQKYFHINATPDCISTNEPPADSAQSAALSPSPLAAPDRESVASYLASDESAHILSGNPLLTGAGAAVKKANPGPSAAPSPSAPGSNGGNSSTGAGNPNLVANAAAGAPQSTADGREATPSASPSTAGPGPAAGLASQLWYQESLSIEQSRLLTAADVLSGKMEPFARTPLTPAATPSQLVGQEVYFSDQIPGYQVTGYLNQ